VVSAFLENKLAVITSYFNFSEIKFHQIYLCFEYYFVNFVKLSTLNFEYFFLIVLFVNFLAKAEFLFILANHLIPKFLIFISSR
jgi:hypothetical protein